MSTIRLRRGSGAPTAGSFVEGEPAWDSTNGKLYIKSAAGSMVEIGGGGTGSGSTYTFASTAPTSPSAGDTWTDADDGITYQYINDGDSSQWVELGPVGQQGSAGDPGAGVPEGGTTGQVLSKVSGTNYDTAWASPAASSTNLSYDAATRTLASDTGTDATLPLVTSSDAGLVPATGGGTTNFLRADGTFAAAAAPFGGYADGNWICPILGTVAQATNLSANRLEFYPFVLQRSCTVTDLGARVTTGAAGASLGVAIYNSSGGQITTPVRGVELSTDIATATTYSAALGTAIGLDAGRLYWMAAWSTSSTPRLQGISGNLTFCGYTVGAESLNTVTSSTSGSNYCLSYNSTYNSTTFPDMTGQTVTVNTSNIRAGIVFLKIGTVS